MKSGEIADLLKDIRCACLGVEFEIEYQDNYIRIVYTPPVDSDDWQIGNWKGRKWLISPDMSDDQIVKTVYAAFEQAVKHEIMKGFTIKGVTLFNPNVDFRELLKISHKEKRTEF